MEMQAADYGARALLMCCHCLPSRLMIKAIVFPGCGTSLQLPNKLPFAEEIEITI